MDTFRRQCHFDGCDQQFIGITREEYVEHLDEGHGELAARIYDEMVASSCPQCDTELSSAEYCRECGWRLDSYRPYGESRSADG